MLCCDTEDLPAVCAGKAEMKRIDDELFDLLLELEPEIKHIKTVGQIVLMVQNGWVSAIDASFRKFRRKLKTVD